MKKEIIRAAVFGAVILAVLYWFQIPPLNPLASAFWGWIFFASFLDALLLYITKGGRIPYAANGRYGTFQIGGHAKKAEEEKREKSLGARIFLVPLGILALMILFGVLSWSAFHVSSYSSRMVPQDGSTEDLPTSDDVSHISLMDTASASILGDRVIGSLSDVVSQFEVSDTYTTLVYKNAIMKAAPLSYGGLFKYFNNPGGTPGYVIVDPQTFDAKFVRTASGIKYSPSGYLLDYLQRHLRFQYPTAMLGTPVFEIDEDGSPYWITCVYGHRFLFGGAYVKGAVVTDPSTGKSTYYDGPANVPEWVDNVYSGSFVCDLYNAYGMLRNGWLNSWIGQKGCLKTTDDYGYLAKGNDLYIYTGITSVAADESNLGFIMVDARTGGCTYVACAGAEEYSAMSAAEGVVQDYGYRASFPSLVTVKGVPSYALVLKDSAGLVKQYAIVNVGNYTVVSVGGSFAAALKDYSRKAAADAAGTGQGGTEETKSVTFKVRSIVFADTDGNTYAYLAAEDGTVYKIAVAADETIVAVIAGDTVTAEYPAASAGEDVITADSVIKK